MWIVLFLFACTSQQMYSKVVTQFKIGGNANTVEISHYSSNFLILFLGAQCPDCLGCSGSNTHNSR